MKLQESLNNFIETFYEDHKDVEKLKELISELEYRKLDNIKQVILIGEMKYSSIKNSVPKLLYADPTKLTFNISEDKITVDDTEYKFTVYKKDAKNTIAIIKSGYKEHNIQYLLKEFIKFGILTINDPEFVSISNDKYLIAKHLEKYNIPQPKYALVENSDIHKGDSTSLDLKLKKIYKDIKDESKFVCKLLAGHGGKGVFICTKSNIMSVLQCIFAIDKETKILVQEYCEIDKGDIRVHVLNINGKQRIIDASMRNKSSDDFRTNLSLGNSLTPNVELTKEQEAIAKNTAKASGLVWTGIDLLPLKNGKTYVIEYNGAPGTPTEITDQNTLKTENEKFYLKLIKNIDEMM